MGDLCMVRDTSKKAYKDIIEEGILGEKQLQVYKYLAGFPYSTDKEISHFTGLEINVVTGRRNELVRMGLVEDAGKRECTITGRLAHNWTIHKGVVSLESVRRLKSGPLKMKCQYCRGRGYFFKDFNSSVQKLLGVYE